ncbi:hypothetical protein D3C76_1580050 [compost metagenome]
MVIGIAQTGGIHHMQRHAIDVDMFTKYVAGSTGNFRHDRCFTPGQRIEQAGFTGIRTTGNHHGHAVAEQGALPGFAHDGG